MAMNDDYVGGDGTVLRLLYHLLFYVIYSLTELILLITFVVQALMVIFLGEPNQSLKKFGANMGVYVQQIWAYISFSSTNKPFPFSDWPSEDE